MFDIDDLQLIYDEGRRMSPKSDVSQHVKQLTLYLPPHASPRQRLWHIINNTVDIPECKMCNNPVKWDGAQPTKLQQYRTYCGYKCLHGDVDHQTKKRNTELQRYGEGRPSIVNKIKTTNRERYGADFAIQTAGAQEKQKQTTMKRYGVQNVMQSPQFQHARNQTCLHKFGNTTPALTEYSRAKTTRSIIQKYGSVAKRYEASHATYRETCSQRYGAVSHNQRHYTNHVIELLTDRERLSTIHTKYQLSQTAIAKTLSVAQSTVGRYFKHHSIDTIRFPVSGPELEVLAFIKSLLPTTEIITNSRDIISPQELDIYIPDLKIAIEYDGLYWHSELQGKDRKYHLNKTLECEKVGIRLIHIFENEWTAKQSVVKSRLANILQLNTTKLYARKCTIDDNTSSSVTRAFMDEHHIQGYAPSSTNISLVCNGEIVAIMTFGRSRFSKQYEYELIRYAVKKGSSVVGGASKLFKYFTRSVNPASIVTYSDNRWNTGKLYTTIGFTYSHTAAPNYFYFSGSDCRLHGRVQFQKHKLEKRLNAFDSTLTEWENMVINGYNRIWDCGNKVYSWHPMLTKP